MSVTVNELTKIYGSQRAVDAISFEAKAGEVLGFLGPNGAGKTTTMKMITGYIPPTSGIARVAEYNVSEQKLAAQKLIGYLPEHNPLYKDMFVREYLQFVAGLHQIKKPKARIDELIEMTGLEREQRKQIGALSKGYRQRVGLAQAMLHNPDVLILDEPTSGLDPNQLAEIRLLIKQLGQEKTVIFSTHIMQEVQAICDRVIIINQGKIVADDPIDRLQSRIKGESQVTIEVKASKKKPDFSKITGVTQVEKLSPYRFRISTTADQDVRPDIFKYCVDQELTLLEMRREELSVEDVFRRLTRNNASN